MEKVIIENIDKGCIPTLNKYGKGQLIGAIIQYITKKDASSFTEQYSARSIIKTLEPDDFCQVLLEHVVKLDALKPIEEIRYIYDFDKDYDNHSIGETELRLYETLSLSVEDVFNTNAVKDAYRIIKSDMTALYNLIESFIDFRYLKGKRQELENKYLEDENHKQIIWKIEEYFHSIN